MRIALACLAAYTAFSFLSILWAASPGDAWEGANRTLLYLLVFALFACWPQRGRPPRCCWWCGRWRCGAGGVHDPAPRRRRGARLPALLPGGRLVYPTGYPNANAAQWLMAAWPALLLARSERLPWALRGVLAGAAVLLAAVALLSQSRGSLYATPVMLVLVFALLPGRTRTFAVLVPMAAGIAAAAPAVLRVGDHLRGGEVVRATRPQRVARRRSSASLAVGLVVAIGRSARVAAQRSASARARRVHRATAAVALGGSRLCGCRRVWRSPGTRSRASEKAWHSFKGGYAEATARAANRLLSGLG